MAGLPMSTWDASDTARLAQLVLTPIAHHIPEPWESWGIAARWNPQHGWHQPDEPR